MASGADFRRIWAEEAIDDDVACAGCGYNLRSLKQGARCPECGEPVTLSLVMFHFRAAHMPAELDPGWIRHLAEGCKYLLVSLLGSMILSLYFSQENWAGNFVFMSGQCAAWVFAFTGIWKLTIAPPDGDFNGIDGFWRQTLRFIASLYAVVPIIFAASGGGSDFAEFIDLVIGICALIGVGTTFTLYQYLRQIARRTRSLWLQIAMFIASLIFPIFYLSALGEAGRGMGRFDYAINFLLLHPLAALAPPQVLAGGAINLARTLSQQDHARGELTLFMFPILSLLVVGYFTARLIVLRLRLCRRNVPQMVLDSEARTRRGHG